MRCQSRPAASRIARMNLNLRRSYFIHRLHRLFYSQSTRTNRRYIDASVQFGTPKHPSAVSAGGVVRESSETRWQENRLLAALPERERARLIPQLGILTLFAKETV